MILTPHLSQTISKLQTAHLISNLSVNVPIRVPSLQTHQVFDRTIAFRTERIHAPSLQTLSTIKQGYSQSFSPKYNQWNIQKICRKIIPTQSNLLPSSIPINQQRDTPIQLNLKSKSKISDFLAITHISIIPRCHSSILYAIDKFDSNYHGTIELHDNQSMSVFRSIFDHIPIQHIAYERNGYENKKDGIHIKTGSSNHSVSDLSKELA